jgi:hypothetical protein
MVMPPNNSLHLTRDAMRSDNEGLRKNFTNSTTWGQHQE